MYCLYTRPFGKIRSVSRKANLYTWNQHISRSFRLFVLTGWKINDIGVALLKMACTLPQCTDQRNLLKSKLMTLIAIRMSVPPEWKTLPFPRFLLVCLFVSSRMMTTYSARVAPGRQVNSNPTETQSKSRLKFTKDDLQTRRAGTPGDCAIALAYLYSQEKAYLSKQTRVACTDPRLAGALGAHFYSTPFPSSFGRWRVFMWRHIKPILQVFALSTAMLVSSLHGAV